MRTFILIGAVLGLFACNGLTGEPGYTVQVSLKGDLSDLKSDTLLLANLSGEEVIRQVAVLENGRCKFTGTVVTPEYYNLYFKGEGMAAASVFLENDIYDITIPVARPGESVEITGGVIQQAINVMQEKNRANFKAAKLDSLMRIYDNATAADKKRTDSIYAEVLAAYYQLQDEYVAANPASSFALACFGQAMTAMPLDSIEAKLAFFQAIPAHKGNRNIAVAERTIRKLKALQPGMQAPDFVQNDPEGNPVKFSDIYAKHKVTMIDFWASWCKPCRAFNPVLLRIYDAYGKRGFEIVGVSLDTRHEAWVKSIEDDKLAWPQVSDLGGWKNAVGRLYDIKFVPQNIFVDRSGKIIGRHLSEEEIVTLLNEMLK